MAKLHPIDFLMIKRAIYIDFEQRIKEDVPQIARVLIEKEYTFYVVDPRLKNAVKDIRIKRRNGNWQYIEAMKLVLWLLDKAESEERWIIGYSTAELKTIVNLLGDEKRITNIYFNANMANWFRKRRKTTFKRLQSKIKSDEKRWNKTVGLKDLLGLYYVKYKYPKDLIGYSAAKSLGDTLKFLEKRNDYGLLPKGVKRKFTQLYRYNKHDCFGMKHLLYYRLSRGD